MKTIPLITLTLTAGIMGCQLENPLDVGDSCANIQYVALEQGQHCNRGDCEDYQAYMEANYCPHNYPLCRIDENRDAYCHKTCDTNQIVCDGSCIDPRTSTMHCGASGLCNSEDSNSEDFEGIQCPSGYKCVDDDNSGARCELSCDNTKVKCMSGDGNYECRDPKSSSSCGVRGECVSNDPNSADFIGEKCLSGQSCLKDDTNQYHCVCDNQFVVCRVDNEMKCIDPKIEAYCGARGACNSDDERSMDYQGKQCVGGEQCVFDKKSGNYDCKCPNGKVLCNVNGQMTCVDPADKDHCGASGACNSDEPKSPDYKGTVCAEGQSCFAGKSQYYCACTDGEILCKDDNGVLKCVAPNESPFCGAKGSCDDPKAGSDNFMGKTCVDTQTCSKVDSGDYDCICTGKTFLCNGKCVTTNSPKSCGAKGNCSSSDENSDNYKGEKCAANESCVSLSNGKYFCTTCDIASGNYKFCGSECTEIAEDRNNCGSCGRKCPDKESFRENAPVFASCEDKTCCYRGGFAKSLNDSISSIVCCSGTQKYKYNYDAGKSCLKGNHYGCYAKEELPFKKECWSQVK